MEKTIKEQIIKNFYKIARENFSEEIIIDDSIIEEIFKDQETLYGINEREIIIFKTSIGMYTNGKKISKRVTNEKLNLNISRERTRQIIVKVLQIIYEENAKIAIEKAKNNPALKDQILNQPLELIGLELRNVKHLKKIGCNTLKELLSASKEEINNKIFGGKIIRFIKNIELEFKYEIMEKTFENINLTIKTRKYLAKRSIYTYKELLCFKPDKETDEDIYNEIKNAKKILNDTISKSQDIEENDENNYILQQLYNEKILLEQSLINLDKDYYEICNLIDNIITSLKLNKEFKCLGNYLIKTLEKKQNIENEITKIKEQIENINNKVSEMMEQSFSEKPNQYKKTSK